MYTGFVYDKETGKPIKDARVSDGRNICLTDEFGKFSLGGWERASLVFVNMLTASHDDWYIEIAEGVESYDFYLTPYKTDSKGCFAQVSDTELGVGDTPTDLGTWGGFLRGVVEKENCDFIIHTGDICRRAGLAAHYRHMNYETMGCPVRYTLGNHDYVNEKYGEYTYETLYGPVWYSFDLGDAHYVVLPIKRGEAPSGYLPSDSDLWLERDLSLKSPEKKLVVLCHEFACNKDFIMRDSGLDLKKYNAIAWVCGHYHNNYLMECGGRYLITTARPDCGGIDCTPASVRTVCLTNDGIESKIIYNDITACDRSDEFLWRTKLSGDILFSSPVISDGKIFVATSSDATPRQPAVYCLDASDGAVVWMCPVKAGIKNHITLAEDTIFALDIFGTLYAIDARCGKEKYQKKIELGSCFSTVCAPLYHNGVIYVGSAEHITALNAADGSIVWEKSYTPPCLVTSTARFLLSDGLLIVGNHWKFHFAVNTTTGERVWEHTDGRDAVATCAVVGACIIKPSFDTLYKIDLQSGKTLKSIKPEPLVDFNAVAEPLIYSGKIYLATANRGVMRFDLETLAPECEYPVGKAKVPVSSYATHDFCGASGTPQIIGKSLVFSSPDGYVYIYDASSSVLLRKISVGAPVYTEPNVCDRKIITADLSGNVTAYEIKNDELCYFN